MCNTAAGVAELEDQRLEQRAVLGAVIGQENRAYSGRRVAKRKASATGEGTEGGDEAAAAEGADQTEPDDAGLEDYMSDDEDADSRWELKLRVP